MSFPSVLHNSRGVLVAGSESSYRVAASSKPTGYGCCHLRLNGGTISSLPHAVRSKAHHSTICVVVNEREVLACRNHRNQRGM